MADEKDTSEPTELISTAATPRSGKVRWSSATGKIEAASPAAPAQEPVEAEPSEEPLEADPVPEVAKPEDPDVTKRPVQWGGTAVTKRDYQQPTDLAESSTGAQSTPDEKETAADQPRAKELDPGPGAVSSPRKRRPSLRTRLRGAKSKAAEIPILVFMAFAIAIVIKTFLVQAFYIPSTSMLPTLRTGDRVLVEKISYRFTDPSRGDVVVFEKSVFGSDQGQDLPWYQDAQGFFRELLGLPTGAKEDYIKRIVAVSGDVVEYKGKPRQLFVNEEKVDQPFIYKGRDQGSPSFTKADCKRLDMQRVGSGCRVPAGRVFVMGDNRGNSEDSRILGPIEEDKIVGRAFVIIWPPSDFGGL